MPLFFQICLFYSDKKTIFLGKENQSRYIYPCPMGKSFFENGAVMVLTEENRLTVAVVW